MIEEIPTTGVIEFHNFQKLAFCMFSWHWLKTLPSGDQSFRALACEGAGWERVEWGIGRRTYLVSRYFRIERVG
jgi:hypothetical protein